jgi:predicted DNA-binding transcriptional regulator AlpA
MMAHHENQRLAGPPFFKNGRSVRYLESDLNTWLLANRQGGNEPPSLPTSTDKRFLTSREAAQYIGMSEGWLRQTRMAGRIGVAA